MKQLLITVVAGVAVAIFMRWYDQWQQQQKV